MNNLFKFFNKHLSKFSQIAYPLPSTNSIRWKSGPEKSPRAGFRLMEHGGYLALIFDARGRAIGKPLSRDENVEMMQGQGEAHERRRQ